MERIPGFMASAYDKAASMAIGSYYSVVANEIVSAIDSGIILDLGTGPGYLPLEVVKRAPAIRVVGIDLTPRLIKIARENSAQADVADRVDFEVMNAAKLRFENNTFDMVFSSGMLHALRSPDKVSQVMRECYRVLKPGGEAWIYDPARIHSGIEIRSWKSLLTLRERLLYKLFTFYQWFNPPHYYHHPEFVQIIAATDFSVRRIEEKDGEIRIELRKA